ncbi:hypothetical protein ACOSQ2_032891 [Xanthoceras sorbifolium]
MLFVTISKNNVHQPRIRIFRWFYEFVFPFHLHFLFSSLSFFFFFFFFFFSSFLSFLGRFSLLLLFLFSLASARSFSFFLYFFRHRDRRRDLWSRHQVATLTGVRAPPSSRARLGRASGRAALCPFLTISSRAVHRDLWSRWLVTLLTARFCHFHREQTIATCGRGDWSRYSLPDFAFFTASEPSRPVVAVTRSRCSLVQFFNFSFFIHFSLFNSVRWKSYI